MGIIWTDTHPRIEAMMLEGYDRMTDQQLWDQVTQLTRATQQMALTGLRRRFPSADEQELRMRLAALWYGPELVHKAFGWSP